MLNINSIIIGEIIERAREINIADDLYMPGDPNTPEKNGTKTILAENRIDLSYSELKKAINKLEPDQQKELIALFLVGRGDYDEEEWAQALEEAGNIPPNKSAIFLLSKPMLADLLEEGMSKLGISYDVS